MGHSQAMYTARSLAKALLARDCRPGGNASVGMLMWEYPCGQVPVAAAALTSPAAACSRSMKLSNIQISHRARLLSARPA